MESDRNFFYANGLEVAVSPYDINLKFLRQGSPENAETGVATQPEKIDEVTVAMSPAHAKAMLPGIFKAIVHYEQTFGSISLESKVEEDFGNTFGKIIGVKK